MKFYVLTLFPEIVESFFTASIMAKAVERKLVDYSLINIRDFAFDKHKTCDDLTYGGGAGMLLMPEPVSLALDSVEARNKRVVYLTPSGKPFTQDYAKELSGERELVFLCGRYEGLDQRVIDEYVTDEVSIGDYVMSSGEIASLAVIDCIYRLFRWAFGISAVHTAGCVSGASSSRYFAVWAPREYPHLAVKEAS